MPVLPTDARSEWDASVLDDARVKHFWDGETALGSWLADPQNLDRGYSGPVVWDAYLLFGRNARWEERPTDLRGAGWTVIGRASDLESEVEAVLERA